MLINVSDWIDKNKEHLIKQTEMLQNTITRMANSSLEIKKVGLTVWATIVGFGFTTTNRYLFVLASVSFTLFGILDIYYLFLEQRFRDNLNRLIRMVSGYTTSEDSEWIEKVEGNFLKLDKSIKFINQISVTLKSWSNLPYLITLLLTLLLLVIPIPVLGGK